MKHKLTLADGKALVLCDKATVHSCEAFEHLRQRWQIENHAIIIHGSTKDLVKVPPGWGASGAPNDGFHQWYHLLRQSYQKVASSQGRYLELRQALGQLDLAVDGSVRYSTLSSFELHSYNIYIAVYIMYVYMYVFLTRYIYTYGEIHLQVKWNFGSFFWIVSFTKFSKIYR